MEEKHGNKALVILLALMAIVFLAVIGVIIVFLVKNTKKNQEYEEKEIAVENDDDLIETEVISEILPEIPVSTRSLTVMPGDKASFKVSNADALEDFSYNAKHSNVATVKSDNSGSFSVEAKQPGSAVVVLSAKGYEDTKVRIRVGVPTPTPKPSPFDKPNRGSLKPDRLTVNGQQIDVYALDGFELAKNGDPDYLYYTNVNDPNEFYTVFSDLPPKMYDYIWGSGVQTDPNYNFYYEPTGYAVQGLGEIYIGYATDYQSWGDWNYRYYMLVGDINNGDMIAVEFLEDTQLPWYEEEYAIYAHWIFGELDPNYTGVANPRQYNGGSTGSYNYQYDPDIYDDYEEESEY
ncbi:MAG: carboxypeptidase-like regulatory domain-containing protein [Lachnospiraceae bacterium]|nr:carboxypeptidase-like regulatory domain-containing protein [Lachnospiraceae bacterium]